MALPIDDITYDSFFSGSTIRANCRLMRAASARMPDGIYPGARVLRRRMCSGGIFENCNYLNRVRAVLPGTVRQNSHERDVPNGQATGETCLFNEKIYTFRTDCNTAGVGNVDTGQVFQAALNYFQSA